MTEQTAPESDGQVIPDTEVITGEPDLESLLAEGQKALKETETQAQPEKDIDKQKLDLVYEHTKKQMQREAQSDVKTAISDIAKSLKDGGVGLSDKVLGRQVLGFASENPLFNQAFEQRHENPKVWEAAQKLAIKEIGESLKDTPDTKVGDARESALASVRTQTGASQTSDKYGAGAIKGKSGADIIRLSDEMAADNAAKKRG